MNVIVCVKEIVDPELQSDNFEISPSGKGIVGEARLPRVLNPNDQQAVEAALRIKEAVGGKVKVLSLGHELHRDIVKKPLAMGADELILLEDEAFADSDSWTTANILANAINLIREYDVVLCGRQAADFDAGQVGSGIAALLGLPSVTNAKKIDVVDGKATVERVTPDGFEILEVLLPAVIMVSNELGLPRYATIQRTLEVIKHQPTVWKPQDIGVSALMAGPEGRILKLMEIFKPTRENTCEIIQGETPEEAGALLAMRLREKKIL